ncbi:MAG: hypothetical protein U1E76_14825 [Planctomycetota bacterium]
MLAFQAADRWPPPDQRLLFGPLTIDVYVSRTAQLFHVVDQLSAWDNSCHGQYREHMHLAAKDEAALQRFKSVRVKKRWGEGLEQTFYVPLDLDAAIRAGKKAGHLNDDEAAVIRPVLEHFAARVDELFAAKRSLLAPAFAKLDRARLTRAAASLARFCGVKKLTVPAFPIASPAQGGGGMDGGRLKWELDSDRVSFAVLLHETTHAFFDERRELLQKTVAATPGLTMTLLGEGFAYALAPGLYPDDERDDNLLYNVTKDRANDQAWSDPGPGRYREYALALRPLLKDALESSKLEDFLPRARDVFVALQTVESARPQSASRSDGPPKLAIAGPATDAVRERLAGSRFSLWIHSFNHDPDSYAKVLPQLGAGDLLVLLVARDDAETIPAGYERYLPLPRDELAQRVAHGETIEQEGARDGLRVVLLAAATKRQLAELVRTSALLHD